MSPGDTLRDLEELEKFAAELARRFARPADEPVAAVSDTLDEATERKIDSSPP